MCVLTGSFGLISGFLCPQKLVAIHASIRCQWISYTTSKVNLILVSKLIYMSNLLKYIYIFIIYTVVCLSVTCKQVDSRPYRLRSVGLATEYSYLKPGFHIIAPVATIAIVAEKRVWHKTFVLSDGSDTMFPFDRRCRWIFVNSAGELGANDNIWARSWCRILKESL